MKATSQFTNRSLETMFMGHCRPNLVNWKNKSSLKSQATIKSYIFSIDKFVIICHELGFFLFEQQLHTFS